MQTNNIIVNIGHSINFFSADIIKGLVNAGKNVCVLYSINSSIGSTRNAHDINLFSSICSRNKDNHIEFHNINYKNKVDVISFFKRTGYRFSTMLDLQFVDTFKDCIFGIKQSDDITSNSYTESIYDIITLLQAFYSLRLNNQDKNYLCVGTEMEYDSSIDSIDDYSFDKIDMKSNVPVSYYGASLYNIIRGECESNNVKLLWLRLFGGVMSKMQNDTLISSILNGNTNIPDEISKMKYRFNTIENITYSISKIIDNVDILSNVINLVPPYNSFVSVGDMMNRVLNLKKYSSNQMSYTRRDILSDKCIPVSIHKDATSEQLYNLLMATKEESSLLHCDFSITESLQRLLN